ncbi:MAG: hypothetical protein J6J39_02075 [Clostridia bacterium]|nr:hypothetical protein [Clostridia bacterium]
MKPLSRKIVLLLLVVLMLISSMFIANAQNTAEFSLKALIYNSETKKYEECSTFKPGETAVIAVSVSGIESKAVRGNTLNLTYDASKLTFQKGNSFIGINDDKDVLFMSANEGKLVVTWDTTSENMIFNGLVYYFKFAISNEIKESANFDFKLSVKELYAVENNFEEIPFTVANDKTTISVTTETVPSGVIELLKKLETVNENSLNDITAAKNAYDGLSAAQKQLLKDNYPNEYGWLSTAYDRYYTALKNASEKEINDIIASFNKDYGEILSRDISKVTLKDEQTVSKLDTAYKALPTTVTSRLGKDVKKKIDALKEKIELLNDATSEVEDFKKAYDKYINTTDEQYTVYYSLYYTYVDEAIMMYGSLSEEAQAQLKKEYARLQEIQAIIDKAIAADEAEELLREKVNAYQQKWLRLMALTSNNVAVEDKSALEMAIADYEALEEDVKERLKGKYNNMKNLLTVIESLSEEEDAENSAPSGGDSENQVITETITETVTEKVKETVFKNREFTKSIYFFVALLIFSLLMLAFQLGLWQYYRKKFGISVLSGLLGGYAQEDDE